MKRKLGLLVCGTAKQREIKKYDHAIVWKIPIFGVICGFTCDQFHRPDCVIVVEPADIYKQELITIYKYKRWLFKTSWVTDENGRFTYVYENKSAQMNKEEYINFICERFDTIISKRKD